MTRPEMTLDKQNIGDATRTSVKRDRLQVVPRPLFGSNQIREPESNEVRLGSQDSVALSHISVHVCSSPRGVCLGWQFYSVFSIPIPIVLFSRILRFPPFSQRLARLARVLPVLSTSLVRHVPKLEVYALGCSNLSFVQRCFSSTSSEFERAVIAKNLAEAAAAEALAAKLKNDAEKSKADAEKSKAETAAIHDKSKAETAAIHDKSKADAEKSKADAEKSKVETAAIHDKSKAETAAIHDKSKADVEKSKAETAAIHDKSKFDAAKSKYFLLFFKGFVILIASVRCLLHFAFVIVSISHAEIFVFS